MPATSKNPYVFANGKDSYMYWNAGLTLGIDKLSLDFRYWDTDIPNTNTCARRDQLLHRRPVRLRWPVRRDGEGHVLIRCCRTSFG